MLLLLIDKVYISQREVQCKVGEYTVGWCSLAVECSKKQVPVDLPPAEHAVQLFFTQGGSTFEAPGGQGEAEP